MKTPSLALLNSLGFTTPAQKILFAANALKLATTSSPSVTISSAIPAITAKPAVIAQTAKAARAATAVVPGIENTMGYAFGELYLNSPSYPVGTPIPAISAKPASAEVIGVPATIAAPLVPALVSPAITAIKGWEDAISISVDSARTRIDLLVDLPYSTSSLLIGSLPVVGEITPSALVIDRWLDTIASRNAEAIVSEPPTLEQYFFKYAKSYLLERPAIGSIIKTTRSVNGVLVPVKRVSLQLAVNGYDKNSDSLQLDEILVL